MSHLMPIQAPPDVDGFLNHMTPNTSQQWGHQHFSSAPMWQPHHPESMGAMQVVELNNLSTRGASSYPGSYGSVRTDLGACYAPTPWPPGLNDLSGTRFRPDGRPTPAPALASAPPPFSSSMYPPTLSWRGTQSDHSDGSPACAPVHPLCVQSAGDPVDGSLTAKHRLVLSDYDDDDAHSPDGARAGSKSPPRRGRKRQRIPHTAVERRYRENLNAHLDKLRQNVPALACGAGDAGDGAKPSKCEVLNGAIEYIGTLSREKNALEVKVGDLEAALAKYERQQR